MTRYMTIPQFAGGVERSECVQTARTPRAIHDACTAFAFFALAFFLYFHKHSTCVQFAKIMSLLISTSSECLEHPSVTFSFCGERKYTRARRITIFHQLGRKMFDGVSARKQPFAEETRCSIERRRNGGVVQKLGLDAPS